MKLAIAPAPSAEIEAVAPVPEMPAVVILPVLVIAALLFDAWVMEPISDEPPMEAPSLMLASWNDETAPVELMDAEASWPPMLPVIASVPPLLVMAPPLLVALCDNAPVVNVPAVLLLLLVIEVEATAPVALTPAEALVPLIAATVAVPPAPLLLVTAATFDAVWPIVPNVADAA